MSSSPEAGPSASYDEQPTQTQSARLPAPRKKARMSQVEIFNEPDAKEKQKLGESLRDLQDRVDDDRANVKNLKIDDFRKAIDQQDSVFQSIQDTESGAKDARVFSARMELAHAWSKQHHQSHSFDTDEFFMQIKVLLGLNRRSDDDDDDEDEGLDELEDDDAEGSVRSKRKRGGGRREVGALGDWEKVGWMAAKMCRRVPGIEFIIEHKKRVVKARQAKAVLAEVVKPTEVQTEENSKEEDETTRNARKVHKALRKADPMNEGINLFAFAVNPESFSQTVENVFYISFLIRDGMVILDVREDGDVVLSVNEAGHEGEGGAGPGLTHQGVMEFDMDIWRMAIDTFNITESLIPTRPAKFVGVPDADTWY